MKRIYEFTVNKEEVVKEESVEKKKDGSEVTTSKDVKKDIPHKFFLRRPTRAMTDEAELYYGVRLAEGIKAGLLTRALLEKRFENDGGTRSEQDTKKYKAITDKLKKFYEEQTKILDIDEKKRSSSQKKRLKELEKPFGTFSWKKIVYMKKPRKAALVIKLYYGGCFIWLMPSKMEKRLNFSVLGILKAN